MISVLLATTGRFEMAKACVQGILKTTEGHDVRIVAAVDKDVETVGVLADLNCVVDYADEYRGCSKAWNDALRLSRGDPVVLAADDLIWEPGWLDAALETLREFPDGWGLGCSFKVSQTLGNQRVDAWSRHLKRRDQERLWCRVGRAEFDQMAVEHVAVASHDRVPPRSLALNIDGSLQRTGLDGSSQPCLVGHLLGRFLDCPIYPLRQAGCNL